MISGSMAAYGERSCLWPVQHPSTGFQFVVTEGNGNTIRTKQPIVAVIVNLVVYHHLRAHFP